MLRIDIRGAQAVYDQYDCTCRAVGGAHLDLQSASAGQQQEQEENGKEHPSGFSHLNSKIFHMFYGLRHQNSSPQNGPALNPWRR